MQMKKYAHLFQKPLDTTDDSHRGHKATPPHLHTVMPRWTFCGDGHLPESPIRIVARQIKEVPADYRPHVELLTHDVDTLYVFVSEEDGGLEAEVTIADEVYPVSSPMTVLLPKNVPHRYVPIKGHGFVFVILDLSCSADYNAHTFPVSG
jgi:hypothetical protein